MWKKIQVEVKISGDGKKSWSHGFSVGCHEKEEEKKKNLTENQKN